VLCTEVFAVAAVAKLETEELRRSARIPKEVPIVLVGWDAVGTQFIEDTKTVLLSRHGAGIVSSHKLAAEQELVLVYPEHANKETEIRVVGQIGSQDGSYTYGVAFLDPNVDFWGVKFPPAEENQTSACGAVLQCNSCGRREFISADALEFDIYTVNGGIFRDCKGCSHPTFWQQASEESSEAGRMPKADLVPLDSVPLPEPSLSAEPCKEKREHLRINVNFTACVRNPGFEDNLVLCENVSRGGLCFKSPRRYYEKTRIEVAAPFSAGSPCILVPAKIVHVEELPGERMFRCGVQYLQLTTKDPLA
jgi:hypothetical protein